MHKLRNLLRNFLKIKPELWVKVMDKMDNVSQEEVYATVANLTRSNEWKYFEEFIRRQREQVLMDLVMSTESMASERIRGRIKSFDFILALGKNYGNN